MAAAVGAIWWEPSAKDIADAADTKLRLFINARYKLKLHDYWALHRFSVDQAELFWDAVWDWSGIIGDKGHKVFDASNPMDSGKPTMPTARLNMAENMLMSHPNARSRRKLAVIGVTEPPSDKPRHPTHLRSLTYYDLYDEVRRAAAALRKLGVGPGDTVAACTPNNVEALVVMLATSAIGAVLSMTASEFGVVAILDRLEQVEPKFLLSASSYRYNGKTHSTLDKLVEITDQLSKLKLRNVVIVDQLSPTREIAASDVPIRPETVKYHSWSGFMALGDDAPPEIEFWRGPATAPCYILFSSGTTGKPKALVHHTGGQVLAHKLQRATGGRMSPSTLEFQFTSTAWMMATHTYMALLHGAGIVLYDGSPLVPRSVLWDIVDQHKVTALGVSPRYLAVLEGENYLPCKRHSLKSLEQVGTTGAPLRPEQYTFIRDAIGNGKSMYLNNGSGGTDICGPFVSTCPSLPIRVAEIQTPVLGMAMAAWNEQGQPVYTDQGDLVCTRPFPNMPLALLGDKDGSRLRSTYFDEYRSRGKIVWCQYDFVSINPATGGMTFFGRSDGVLNPSGVRFGSSELYNVVEQMSDVIDDSLAVGQKVTDDERVILFVKLRTPAQTVPADIVKRIRTDIAKALSPRHVPALIVSAPDIPYNATGKKLEVAVKKFIHGTPKEKVNTSACANPECLEFYLQWGADNKPQRESKL